MISKRLRFALWVLAASLVYLAVPAIAGNTCTGLEPIFTIVTDPNGPGTIYMGTGRAAFTRASTAE